MTTPGVIRYDANGLPICEICDKSFHRVAAHVRQKHHMTAKEYKKKFGLDNIKGICSQESHDKSSDRVFENFNKCVGDNLIKEGTTTRFKKGCQGRTGDMVSTQTYIRLCEQAKEISNLNKPTSND